MAGAEAQPAFSDLQYNLQFELSVPEEWETARDVGMMRAITRSPLESPEDQFRENVNVILSSVPPGTTLAEYADYDRTQLQQMATELEFIEESEATLSGYPALRKVYTHTLNDRRLRFLQYSILKDSRVYVLTGTAPVETFETYVDVFERIIQSFELG